ncbi:low affinity immunoglobulin epsilon Fc receptor-like isoform X2 [Osmerus eperlanus]|uniref:low affinity immunoglobulin epsilon Fc receptor-like isoform X2 n=1 Tax=Osmerus eperlanus TaxID=29151 RepID=UPI002E0EA201
MDQRGEPSHGKLSEETITITSTGGHKLSQTGRIHSGGSSGCSGAERDQESSRPPYKHAVVSLGLLCTLLLITLVTICVHYYKASFSCSLLKTESQLQRDIFDTARSHLQILNGVLTSSQDELQQRNTMMTLTKEQLEKDYLKLIASNQDLRREHQQFTTSYSQLQAEYKDLTTSNSKLEKKHSDQNLLMNHLQGELQNMVSDREQLSRELFNISGAHAHLKRVYLRLAETKNKLFVDVVSLSEMKAIVNKDLVAMVRERDHLKRMLTELVNFLPVDRHCPIRDPVTQERVCSPCLKGWKLFSSKCYFFSTEKRSWSRSRVDCVKQGGDLVIIDSPEEQDFVRKHTPQYHSPAERYWIGLDSQEDRGIWVWVDNTRLSEGYWLNESSSVHASRDKECVSTLRETSPARSWREAHCRSRFRWICEGPALILSA